MIETICAENRSAFLPEIFNLQYTLKEESSEGNSWFDFAQNLADNMHYLYAHAVIPRGTHYTYGQVKPISASKIDLDFVVLTTALTSTLSDSQPNWMSRFLRFCADNKEDAALKEISLVTTRLKSAGDFTQLRDGLKKIDLAQLPDIALAGLLRNIFSVRNHIEEWDTLVSRAEQLLIKRGRNPRALLRGLKSFS
ncbi:hypothetical protein SCB29_22325 [Paraburkholderia sp. SIMBA_055]